MIKLLWRFLVGSGGRAGIGHVGGSNSFMLLGMCWFWSLNYLCCPVNQFYQDTSRKGLSHDLGTFFWSQFCQDNSQMGFRSRVWNLYLISCLPVAFLSRTRDLRAYFLLYFLLTSALELPLQLLKKERKKASNLLPVHVRVEIRNNV